jgi:hypothetical protein
MWEVHRESKISYELHKTIPIYEEGHVRLDWAIRFSPSLGRHSP